MSALDLRIVPGDHGPVDDEGEPVVRAGFLQVELPDAGTLIAYVHYPTDGTPYLVVEIDDSDLPLTIPDVDDGLALLRVYRNEGLVHG